MKTVTKLVMPLVALAVLAAAPTDSKPGAGSPANPGFEKLKSLVGDWKGTTKEGTPIRVSYSLISDDSALMERLEPAKESTMITIYHPDGQRLMMTHYCSAHNQPRMRADAAQADGKSMTFKVVDVANLASPDAGHMVRLVMTFQDPDHFTQEWTYNEKGKSNSEVFSYERAK
jgi:hypothetical protein